MMAKANDEAIKMTLDVVGEQSDREVPHDTGALSRTRFIKVEDGKGLISYGGGSGTGFPLAPYAWKWHRLDADFQKGRKSHYLEDPFNHLAGPTYKNALKMTAGQRF